MIRHAIQRAERSTVRRVIMAPYVIAAMMSIFPPLYLAISGDRSLFLGLPFSVGYMVLVSLLVTLSVSVAYYLEHVRDEIGD